MGVLKCVTSDVSWFIPGNLYWYGENDIGEIGVVDESGDMFGLTNSFTSFHVPYIYTFTRTA